ncbi:MAG: SPOR domain-containing protein, partial [Acidobacteriota bacterium]
MTTSEERSYYEIALTNRQVAFAIVTLLFCVVGAFVAGLWVAREAIGERGTVGTVIAQREGEEPFAFFGGSDDSDAAEAAPADAAAVPEGDGQDRDGQGVGAAEMPVQRVRTPERETPDASREALAAEPEVRQPESPRPEPQPVQAETAPEPEPTLREDSPEPVVVARSEEPAVAADPPASTPVASSSPAPPAAGSRVIQVFSSADREQAQALLGRLEQAGYSAFMDPLDNGTRTMYRVRVGPYGSEDAAKSAASELRREFRLETWITSR